MLKSSERPSNDCDKKKESLYRTQEALLGLIKIHEIVPTFILPRCD